MLRSGSFHLQLFEGLGSSLGCNPWVFGFEGSRQPLAVNDQTDEVVAVGAALDWLVWSGHGAAGLATVFCVSVVIPRGFLAVTC